MRECSTGWSRGFLLVCSVWFVLAGTSACTTYYGTRTPAMDMKAEEESTQVGPSNEEAMQEQMEYDVWHDTNL